MTAAPAGSPTRPTADGSDEPTATAESSIHVTTEGTTVVIAVAQCLDRATGAALVDAARAAVVTGPARLDIDLRGLDSFTDEGARALVDCRSLGGKLVGGLHYRTGRGPGREALLAAYADVESGDLAE
jgi:hypothetical protein